MRLEKEVFLVVSLFLGLSGAAFFAHCALKILTSKGNTIRDILENRTLKEAEAIRIEILDKIKLSSNYPAVGLFVLAAALGAGPFCAAIYYVMSAPGETINVVGRIQNYGELFAGAGAEHLCIEFREMVVTPGGQFSIPLRAVENPQVVIFESQRVLPVTLMMQYQQPQRKLFVEGLSDQRQTLDVVAGTAVFPLPVLLNRSQ